MKRIFTRVCIPPPESHLAKPVSVSLIHTGIHHSHIMAVYKGLYHCTKCGSILGRKIVKLGNSCMTPSVAGKRNLEYISNNKRPQGVSVWPSEHLALPKCTPRFVSQSSYYQPSASRSLVGQAQQHNASVAADSSLACVAAASNQVASLGVTAASSSSSSNAISPLPPIANIHIDTLEDSSGSD